MVYNSYLIFETVLTFRAIAWPPSTPQVGIRANILHQCADPQPYIPISLGMASENGDVVPTPQAVAALFVKGYYTTLSADPAGLHVLFTNDSQFTFIDPTLEQESESAKGRQVCEMRLYYIHLS